MPHSNASRGALQGKQHRTQKQRAFHPNQVAAGDSGLFGLLDIFRYFYTIYTASKLLK